MKLKSAIYIIGLLLLAGCTSTQSITSLNNKAYFKESPLIVIKDDRYFLMFVYSDNNDALSFAMNTESKIKNDSLIFYLPVTTSSFNMKGRTQFEEILTRNKIEIIRNNKVFWEEPDRTFVPMDIQKADEILNLLEKDINGKTH